jgi:predicted nuclease of predicted toxin-antitoxin system
LKLRDLAYLADESLDPDVATHLKTLGWDVKTATEMSLLGKSDAEVLQTAFAAKRVVLTHDSDFGALAINLGEPCFGIVYLRPGHIRAEYTISTLDAVLQRNPDVEPPFILVASRRDRGVTLRLRLFKHFRKPQGES